MAHRVACPVALLVVLLAGCGNSRTPVPSLFKPAPAVRLRTLAYPSSGVRFRAPSTWPVIKERHPLVTLVTSGAAAVALWRFPQTEPLPSNSDQLAAARSALISTARARNRSLRVIKATIGRVDGADSIELDAFERIDGQLRRVRSMHVFAYGAEIVLEEYAPPSSFHSLDRSVFSPIKRSLQIFAART